MAVNLDQQQLLDIAMEVQRNPTDEKALTDYLTTEERDVVRKLIKNLRASAMAMKTYVQKTVYQASYKNAQCKWMKASASAMEQFKTMRRSEANYKSVLAIRKRLMSNLLRLNKEQLVEVELLNKMIAECQLNIYRAFDEAGISPAKDPKTLHVYQEGQMLAEMNTYLFSQGVGTPQDAKDLENVVSSMKKWSKELNERIPGFAESVSTWVQLMDAAMDELRITYGVPSTMAIGRMEKMVVQERRMVNFRKSLTKKRLSEALKASEEMEVEKSKALSMANWYIVAAMGDALVELGQNLAY